MARWGAPSDIEKLEDISSLPDDQIYYYHDQMHIFWEKILEGMWFDWSFLEVYYMHKKTVIEMLRRKLIHLSPINNLDSLEFVKNIQEMTDIVNSLEFVKNIQEMTDIVNYIKEKQ